MAANVGAAPARQRGSFSLGHLMVYVVLGIIAFIWVVPTIGLLISSFRPPEDVTRTGWWTVLANPGAAHFTLNNYKLVTGIGMTPELARSAPGGVASLNLAAAVINSMTVAIPATVIPILIAAFAAYGFAWIRFPGRKLFFIVVVALLVVPIQIALIPILQDYTKLQLNGTYLGVWLAHAGFGLPLAVYLLYSYISTLPREVLESAFLDGASHFTIFTRLVLPLAAPALAAFAIFQFLWVWNDLLVALVFLGSNPNVQVLTTKLLGMIGSYGTNWQLLTAGAFVSMIVPLIVFFSLQRYFVRGMMAGSVKG